MKNKNIGEILKLFLFNLVCGIVFFVFDMYMMYTLFYFNNTAKVQNDTLGIGRAILASLLAVVVFLIFIVISSIAIGSKANYLKSKQKVIFIIINIVAIPIIILVLIPRFLFGFL